VSLDDVTELLRAGDPDRVEIFGRRTDVTPQAFGFVVEEAPERPRYRRTGPSGEEIVEQLRRAGVLDEEHFA
jgi:hypothetical protein